ncbi:MAG: OmpA family protein [Candidatus Hydrogenedentes bacterium]|nr:OmpA family protein [Candidatus Hydrogenedentota bacterium]
MSKRSVWIAFCVVVMGSFTGCHHLGPQFATETTPGLIAPVTRVTPLPGDVLKVDQIMILADVTNSTLEHDVFGLEKNLLNGFVDAMPDAPYQMGFSSFAGVSQDEWMWLPLQYGNLESLKDYAANLQFLGSTTPLHQGIAVTGKEFEGRSKKSVLVVFSDGRTHPHQRVLDALADISIAHDGELCIYTINCGYSEPGRELLQKMSRVTHCGGAWQAHEVNSPLRMEAMVREIFFGPGAALIEQRTIVLQNDVLFDFDKAVLKPEGRAAVDTVIAEARSRRLDRLVIEGHTCDLGSDAYNMDLSQRRANAVRSYMIEQGIDGSRITTEAYGESRPAAANINEANRKLNRRAEFRFRFQN